jgi:hypothetical protein
MCGLSSFYPKCLEPKMFWIWDCLGLVWEYLPVHNEVSWGCYPSLNIKFIYVSYAPYTHSPKVTLYIFIALCFDCELSHEVEFSTCGIILVLKKFQILKYFSFQIFLL